MVSLEQVKLLEAKVARAIDYVERVSGENATLQEKLESYQKRIDELEVLVQRFKEEQGRIEDGILSALDKLNQFEDAIEKSLTARGVSRESSERNGSAAADLAAADDNSDAKKIPEPDADNDLVPETAGDDTGEDDDSAAGDNPDTGLDLGEPEDAGEDDRGAGSQAENGELDIF
jgi:FtsZ-binding cell division protein ZapB